MKAAWDVSQWMLDRLSERYTLRKEDIGADACLKKSGMRFETESY